MASETAIDVRDVPPEVVAAVEAEAEIADRSMNDVIVEALSRYYGLRWEPSGYAFSKTNRGSDHWNVKVDVALARMIKAHARGVGTQRGVILLALAHRFGLPPQDPRKRVQRALSDEDVTTIRHRKAMGDTVSQLSRDYQVKRETIKRALGAGRSVA